MLHDPPPQPNKNPLKKESTLGLTSVPLVRDQPHVLNKTRSLPQKEVAGCYLFTQNKRKEQQSQGLETLRESSPCPGRVVVMAEAKCDGGG